MDEIFSSTNYNEGFSAAYSICNKLTTFQNSISIVTTHYTQLSHLENTTNKFKNYKFYVTYDDNNNIIFPFKIQRGFSKQYIALELLRENGFDDDIIDNAITICNKLNNNEVIFNDTSDSKSDSSSEIKSDSKSEIKSDSKSEIKSDSKSEIKSDSKSEIKSDSKSEIKSDSSPEIKSEKSRSKVRSKSKSRIRSKIDTKYSSDVKVKLDSDSDYNIKI